MDQSIPELAEHTDPSLGCLLCHDTWIPRPVTSSRDLFLFISNLLVQRCFSAVSFHPFFGYLHHLFDTKPRCFAPIFDRFDASSPPRTSTYHGVEGLVGKGQGMTISTDLGVQIFRRNSLNINPEKRDENHGKNQKNMGKTAFVWRWLFKTIFRQIMGNKTNKNWEMTVDDHLMCLCEFLVLYGQYHCQWSNKMKFWLTYRQVATLSTYVPMVVSKETQKKKMR